MLGECQTVTEIIITECYTEHSIKLLSTLARMRPRQICNFPLNEFHAVTIDQSGVDVFALPVGGVRVDVGPAQRPVGARQLQPPLRQTQQPEGKEGTIGIGCYQVGRPLVPKVMLRFERDVASTGEK